MYTVHVHVHVYLHGMYHVFQDQFKGTDSKHLLDELWGSVLAHPDVHTLLVREKPYTYSTSLDRKSVV